MIDMRKILVWAAAAMLAAGEKLWPYHFDGYWRDVGTLDSFWEANIDLTNTDPQLDLYDTSWPIWTALPQRPPAKFVHNDSSRRGVAIESIVSNGCIISGELNHAVVGSSCRIHSNAKVDYSVLAPRVTIGRGARVSRCIIDTGVDIPAGMIIGEDTALDAKRFRRTDKGVTLVTREMMEKLGIK